MFKNIVEKLHEKTPLTIASVSNVRNLALRRCMIEELNKKKYSENSFLAEPFYEAMFPWRLDKKKQEERCSAGEVNPVIKDMHNRVIPSKTEGQDDIVIDSLYEHQKRSIEEIRKGKSIVVITGTGSGKTFGGRKYSKKSLKKTEISNAGKSESLSKVQKNSLAFALNSSGKSLVLSAEQLNSPLKRITTLSPT